MKQRRLTAGWVGPLALLLAVAGVAHEPAAAGGTYEPRWESLDSRPTPQWFQDAKFGIFIHWGVYSVPAWGPKTRYAEWYWWDLNHKGSETEQFHYRVYGPDFEYFRFADLFKPYLFDADEWADLFACSGARYVVLTSKHHDGYCLWPSAEADRTWGRPWNAMSTAPRRDLVGELTAAVKQRPELKMGLYYSLYEWYNPLYRQDVDRYVAEHMLPQLRDLVQRYEPSIVWADGGWDHPSSTWRTEEFLAWLFNESAVKDVVAVNDRWGKECRYTHGGYYTTEYGLGVEGNHPWEECRGMGHSFGYNRNETVDQYRSARAIIHTLVQVAAKGGCLLLDIGPTADGRIPVIMQQRLMEIGDWLSVNGEAIYGSRPWVKAGIEKEFVVERIDRRIDFTWYRGSPDERISPDHFTGEWTGWIRPRYSEEYTFELEADARGALWIDGKPLIDGLDRSRTWRGTATATVRMEAGKKVPIRVRFVEETKDAHIRLSWSSPSQPKQIVPGECLFSDPRRNQGDGLRARYTSQGYAACYTTVGDAVYVISLGWPQADALVVDLVPPKQPTSRTRVRMLGRPGLLPWGYHRGRVQIELSDVTVDQLPCDHAYVFKLTGFNTP